MPGCQLLWEASRAGRELTEDVKKRIKVGCQESGLQVASAHMYLRKDMGDRVVHVCASPPGWQHECPLVEILTVVKTNGYWSGDVDVRCMATDQDPVLHVWVAPVMRGRGAIPIGGLIEHLMDTLEEREQVMAAVKLGVEGPYVFEQSRWAAPSFG